MQQPEKIDKYQVLSVLGKGAMGIVYHAYDPVVKRDVAIKFLSSLDSEETELISRFEREARLAGALRHPNIVTIYDLGHLEGRPYIVMEYITGKDLETIIRKREPLTNEQKIEIILQICKGLHSAHQKGIIHRDIKPANVRIQDDNTVRIMDFGIARMGQSQLTRSGYIIGTLQYMSPEQVQGEQLDPRTDVFSTGVIAYELFTYSNPFSGEHTVDIMYKILNVRPQPLHNLPEEYGTELNQVIMRALEKNKDLRYSSAKEMADDLEEQLFYLKSLKFKPRVTGRERPVYAEGATQSIPMDQLPVAPVRDPEIPPTVVQDASSVPAFTPTAPQKAPRTGTGANFSETAQVLIQPQEHKTTKKFYILGAIMAIVFLAAIFALPAAKKLISGGSALPVNSRPAGAEVFMDSQPIGKTPLTIKEKRDMRLLFKLPEYQEKELVLSADAWPAEVSIVLNPAGIDKPPVTNNDNPANAMRRMQVASNPPGAVILLDGKEIGTAPVEIQIDTQDHKLTARLDGYEPFEQTLDSNVKGNILVTLQQQTVPGAVAYEGSFPVIMYSQGRMLGKGRSVSLAPGNYTITLKSASKNAYIRVTRDVDVVAGQTTVVRAPAMGRIRIKANPSRCKIMINGEFIDYPPIDIPISAGSHAITFLWESEGRRKTENVAIDAGETRSVTGVRD